MKRRICAVLSLCVLLAGCSPGAGIRDEQAALAQPAHSTLDSGGANIPDGPADTIKVAYDPTDSLNPYKMRSALNRLAVPLIYDGLTRLDRSYRPENLLATDITMSDTGLCVVSIDGGARFSDGSPLTAQDVIYSYERARASGSDWSAMLSNVASVREVGGKISFQLISHDADFPALLSFPIIKNEAADEDSPAGIGRYMLSGEWENGLVLTANSNYRGKTPSVATIQLTKSSDPDALAFSLKTGEINVAYSDLSTQGVVSMSPSSVPVTLNNMVYLGVNAGRAVSSKASFRRALSAALDRDEMVAKAYSAKAQASSYPFNPDFYRMQEVELGSQSGLSEAEQLLDGLGYSQKDESGNRLRGGVPLTLTLLANSENSARLAAAELVAGQLMQIGITVQVVSKPFEQYRASIATGDYDLYIGEMRMAANMDFTPLLGGGEIGYGAARNQELADAVRAYRATGNGIGALCGMFEERSPFIPLLFRQGMLAFNGAFRTELIATEQDVFYNIEEW